MAIRSIVILNIGPPFGGFRLAARAGFLGLNNRKIFEKLERGIDSIFEVLNKTAIDNWQNAIVNHSESKDFKKIMGSRPGIMDYSVDEETNGHVKLIVRACIPFRIFSFGGWTVYDGIILKDDNMPYRLSDQELFKYW